MVHQNQAADGLWVDEQSTIKSMFVCVAVWCRFIWITGWSVWTETMLTRKPMAKKNSPTLGELLKFKAAQGVKVR
jgi:hypothetical protein